MPPVAVTPPPFDSVTAYGIGGLAVIVAAGLVAIARRHAPAYAVRLGGGLAAWMALTALAARSGWLARFDVTPPPMAGLMLLVFVAAFGTGLSPLGAALARQAPLSTLVGLQVFRLPLELLMHRAATLGIMPPELSYGGYNFDIATGAGALILWVLLTAGIAVPRALLWAWNVWGLGCLGVITVIALATSPMVRAFGDDPAHVNTWVLHLPYVWLPAVLVVIALAGHVVITRALRPGTA
ncbi:MAG: hypothetical protein R2708_23420 [Vicinamibacterales bacterium]